MNDESSSAQGPSPARDAEAGPSGAAVALPVDLPIDFEAFVLGNRTTFLSYAEDMLGDVPAAKLIVRQVFSRIGIAWQQILREPNLEASTWAMLTTAVVSEVHRLRLDDQVADRVAAARVLLAQMRESLLEDDVDDTECGLIPALRALTPREFDVVILKASKRSTPFAAWLLRIHPSTVDRNHKQALARLEELLGPRRVLHADTPNRRRGERR